MRKILIAVAACAALSSCNVTGATIGMASAQAADKGFFILATVTKDGDATFKTIFVKDGQLVVFPTKESCEGFVAGELFVPVRASLDEFVQSKFGDGAKGSVSCEPLDSLEQ